MDTIIDKFSPHLFWDADLSDIDMEKHSPYIVQRVLEYGLLEDWHLLRSYYGLQHIAEISMRLRSLEPRALSFICTLSKTRKEDYKCYILRQSNLQPWIY